MARAAVQERGAAGDVTVSEGPRRLALPAPVRFVHMERPGWREAVAVADFDALMRDSPAALEAFSLNGDLLWTVQTWCRLRDAGYGGVELAARPAPCRINLAKSKVWSRLGRPRGCFAVSIQADYPKVLWAQGHIQQNRDLEGPDNLYQTLWPQAAIIPRDPARRGVRRVGFLGKADGNLALGEAEWTAHLARLGLEFVAHPPSRWHDFSDLDIALGIRDFSIRRHPHKPPNKLLNAWIAGVPFIGGSDSAFTQVGSPGRDYLRAMNLAETLTALERLRDDPALYGSLIAAGREKAQAFTTDAILGEWIANLEGPVAQRYRQWATAPGREARRSLMRGAAQQAIDGAKRIGRTLLGREFEA